MDIPTYIVLSAFGVSIAIVVILRLLHVSKSRLLGTLLVSISTIWALLTIGGEFVFTWAGNTACSKYLGCVSGFFGYDAFEHLFFGIAAALAILWLCARFPKYSILHEKRWKAFLTVVAIVALIAVLWEILECAHDYFRIDVLGEHLFNFRLHINTLDQPTNLDTMGDITFSLIGSIVGFFLTIIS